MTRFLLLMLVLAAPLVAREVAVIEVPLTDARLSWRGRFDRRDPAGPRFDWPGTALVVRVRGTALHVRLAANGSDRVQVRVDGKPLRVFTPEAATAWYPVAENLPHGDHTIEVIKITEPLVGRLQILGVATPAGSALLPAPPPPALKLECVGDSITCGFGNEAPTEHHHFTPLTENNELAYGALAARALPADYHCIAWSGRKLWPDNTIPEIYDLALASDPASAWDLASWIPDVITVNLCTNDFGGKNPAEEGWVAAYHALLARMRRRAPQARIFCCVGPMMNDTWSETRDALREARRYVQRVVREQNARGDARVFFLEFPSQTPADGYGADFHPSLSTHERMARQLVEAIRSGR